MKSNILNKSINELEGTKSTSQPNFYSYPVQKSNELLNKKLLLFEPKDLRLMIGQNIGLKYLIPLAINVLKKDPLIDSEFYNGDLLLKVLSVDKNFWYKFPNLKEKIISLLKKNEIDYSILDDDTKNEIISAYKKLINNH